MAKSSKARCADCNAVLDFKSGVRMRGPLDARVVCLPCGRLLETPQLELGSGHGNGTDSKGGT